MLVGDSPQSIVGRLSISDVQAYLNNRRQHGVNALWVHLLCNEKIACNADGSTHDGIPPFTVPGDLATPNSIYFDRVDEIIRLAGESGIVILLDVVETIGWLTVFKANGTAKAESFGRYVGERYRHAVNLIWMYGNDFQTWGDPADDEVVLAVAKGVASVDRNHIATTELNYLDSASLDDPKWHSLVDLNGVYTYYPTYAKILEQYNRTDHKPIILIEASYEFEHLSNTAGGSPLNLRRQEYWAMLSGAAGQLYGSRYTWQLPGGWKRNLDTPGIKQLSYTKTLFSGYDWHRLIPDQKHRIVVAGHGAPAAVRTGSVATDTYVTTASTPETSLAISYLPSLREITVDMSTFPAHVHAYWYDPTKGNRVEAKGSPFGNEGRRLFAPPGKNGDGDEDWVLVLHSR